MTHPSDRIVERLARVLQQRDARGYGAIIQGEVHPTWDEIGDPGRAEYSQDADFIVRAMRVLGWAPAGKPLKRFELEALLIADLVPYRRYVLDWIEKNNLTVMQTQLARPGDVPTPGPILDTNGDLK